MIRIMTPIDDSDTSALQAAIDLAAQASTFLPEFVPD
jgi:hypothetical protein